MGLEDLIPEDKRGKSSRSRKKSVSDREDIVVFGSGELQKAFERERWENIKEVMTTEMGVVPNEVVNNYPAQERFETLHEAAMLERKETTLEELGRSSNICEICGKEMGKGGVSIAGIEVCINHTAGQVSEALNEN